MSGEENTYRRVAKMHDGKTHKVNRRLASLLLRQVTIIFLCALVLGFVITPVYGATSGFPGTLSHHQPPTSTKKTQGEIPQNGETSNETYNSPKSTGRDEEERGSDGNSSDNDIEDEEEFLHVIERPNSVAESIALNGKLVKKTQKEEKVTESFGNASKRSSSPTANSNLKTIDKTKIQSETTTENEKIRPSSVNSSSLNENDKNTSYQPLRTLKKLQAMLDRTDYATSSSVSSRLNNNKNSVDRSILDFKKQYNSRKHDPTNNAIELPNDDLGGNKNYARNIPSALQTSTVSDIDQEMPQQTESIESENADFKTGHGVPNFAEDQVGIEVDNDGDVTEEEFEDNDEIPLPEQQQQERVPELEQIDQEVERLWTSRDRSKYKKTQREQKRWKQQQQQQSQFSGGNSSDDDASTEETDDGLNYVLPNLPVYLSDGEATDTDSSATSTTTSSSTAPPQSYPQLQQHYPYPQNNYAQQQQQQQYPGYPPYPPIPPVPPYHQNPYAAQYAAWTAAMQEYHSHQQQQGYPQQQQQYPYYYRPNYASDRQNISQQQQQHATTSSSINGKSGNSISARPRAVAGLTVGNASERKSAKNIKKSTASSAQDNVTGDRNQQLMLNPEVLTERKHMTLAEAGTMINFDSVQKVTFIIVGTVLLCYCAVSPRTLPVVDYNMRFNENIQIVSVSTIFPILFSICVFDAKENDINTFIGTLYTSFTLGYALSFLFEIIWTTILRLAVFCIWEPAIFQLTPEVPSLVLPWVLRDKKYRPKRITLFAADFATSCIASPIIEEYIKLKVVQWSVNLPRNYQWKRRKSDKKGKKRSQARELIERSAGEHDVTNINTYVTHMLAASLGIKMCDTIRRILMYTKRKDVNKTFYAFCRGIFPIHELCGTMTSLELAKRYVLGMDVPVWRMIAPAVVLHGMANFRGMKPIFKWNSSTPWSEMQLSPWNMSDTSTFSQILSKSFAKLVWASILARVLGYCVKNYFLIGRKAVKRTTTYAGKQSAFSAELEAAEMLKKSKDKK